jgi:hypothetical protein
VYQSLIRTQDARGHDRRARFEYCPIAQNELDAVREEETDPVAFANTQPGETSRESVDLVSEFAVPDGAALEEDCRLAGIVLGGAIEYPKERLAGIRDETCIQSVWA